MDAKTLAYDTLAYDFDEEGLGFGEPPTPAPAPGHELGLPHKSALALIGLGLLVFVLCLAGPSIAGTWLGLAASFGLMAFGTALTFWLAYRDTLPGIKHDGTFFRGALNHGAFAWLAGIFMTGFYIVLYFYDDLKRYGAPAVLDPAARVLDPLAELFTGHPADRWFLYGFLYTACVLVFGLRTALKYRHNRYQKIRTASVAFFQLGFAFLIPNLLKGLNQPDFYLTYFWPLKAWYGEPDGVHYYWTSGTVGTVLICFALGMVVIGTPLLTWRFGKRWYCSWVCGCGGLAETLGDPWRQLSSKKNSAWRFERYSVHIVLVLVVLSTGLLWLNSARRGEFLGEWSNPFSKAYGVVIGSIFSGVVGVGFYPLLGSRVWCRFGCPQAAILGLIQRCFSRFRITTNGGQCMSCGNCSTYCEMGIDVRAYAQKSESIVRASCVGCGVCAAVCPRGVLKLENGPARDRFEGAENPWRTFLDAFREPDIHGYRPWNGPR